MDSSFVILYNRERLIGDRPEIAVSVKSVGWNSMQAAQLGYEGDMLPLGPAEDGDEIIVKRGIVKINAPIYLDCDLTFSREKNYAGGGGGGWSGGGRLVCLLVCLLKFVGVCWCLVGSERH